MEEEAGADLMLVSRWGSPLKATAAQAEQAFYLLGCGTGTYTGCSGKERSKIEKDFSDG